MIMGNKKEVIEFEKHDEVELYLSEQDCECDEIGIRCCRCGALERYREFKAILEMQKSANDRLMWEIGIYEKMCSHYRNRCESFENQYGMVSKENEHLREINRNLREERNNLKKITNGLKIKKV